MPVKRTDSEFGGRGGVHPPKEFVPDEADLQPWEQASLERRTDGPTHITGREDDVVAARAVREARARKNDTVGK